ncbi:hypothetical protein AGABI1DRAFT_82873 [Agaricus bisporus var. burnettii JB137-S8]|uniref:DUF6593 domain-containing protein n=1 Tax=Agaricus bisporus var. burnettii (strain JB137-S8 / ATCC MYA-4627 / FGSC 10392) TaxID=597362 RepID=K5X5V7_AGABU|nr:uncharacterized protein AGABI1DRAFT_82873 [Agaricus bisporus var. burnettii JB137-S8]EKM83246.1 hypothetical protein AGABI1DRAFT_82873 [Agaricus bisporus var. burnettii JB137-S8]
MRLILSSPHPRNSAYSTEDGQVLYKVDKPRKLRNEIATVRKAVNTVNGVWEGDFSFKKGATSPLLDVEPQEKNELDKDGERRSMNSQDGLFNNSDTEDDASGQSTSKEPAAEGHFAFYAQVEYHTFASSRFRYNSLDVSVSDYFRKEGWSWYGRGRVFKACDGEEYRWDLRAGHLEMIKNDGSKKRVVKFREYRPSLGPLMKRRPASLEVDDSCIPILDEIVMTFIYCEKLRKERERQSRNAAASGGG